jgi:6-phosphogluconate dehydrogenase (decarboxylating)
MTIGLIGLGENGFLLAQKWMQEKNTVVAFDKENELRRQSAELGIVTTSSIQAVALHLPSPRVIWCNMPANEALEPLLAQLAELLSAGDVVIVGGDDAVSSEQLQVFTGKNIHVLQVSMKEFTTVRGDQEAYQFCKRLFGAISGESESRFIGA